ncbi:MAG: hypothetical protein WAL97_07390 [Halobacteriota archaeon]
MTARNESIQNISELRNRLIALDVEVSERSLMRWADKKLIAAPALPEHKRRRLWTAAPWLKDAIWQAAGVWILRDGSSGNWSRRILNEVTVKKVQQVATEMYAHPTVLLSLPDDTKEEDDPPLDAVDFALECAPNVGPYLIPYLVAVEKARHDWPLKKEATVSFEWAESAKGAKGEEVTRKLNRVSVTEPLHGKAKLRFFVGEKDVREHFLERRQIHRELIIKNGPEYRIWKGVVPKGCIWPLASKPIHMGGETSDEVLRKYKKEEYSEAERLSRLNLAVYQEETDTRLPIKKSRKAESKKQGKKSSD